MMADYIWTVLVVRDNGKEAGGRLQKFPFLCRAAVDVGLSEPLNVLFELPRTAHAERSYAAQCAPSTTPQDLFYYVTLLRGDVIKPG